MTAIEYVLGLCRQSHDLIIDHRVIELPADTTALLKTMASSQHLNVFAECHSIDKVHFKHTARQFLRDVILTSDANPYRGLVLDEDAEQELCVKHKRLLQNIFHPDKSDEPEDASVLLHVQSTFKLIQQPLSNMQNETPMYNGPTIQTHKPVNNYSHHKQTESINLTLAAGLLGMGILAVLIYFVVPAPQDAIVRQADTQDVDALVFNPSLLSSMNSGARLQLTGGMIDRSPFQELPPSASYALTSTPDQTKVRTLLNNLEEALEGKGVDGVLSNRSRPAASVQLTRLFNSSEDRKVFLHDFSWTYISEGVISGSGKYLTRFNFGNATPQIIRSGDCQMELTMDDSGQLLIRQFLLEDNLH